MIMLHELFQTDFIHTEYYGLRRHEINTSVLETRRHAFTFHIIRR